MNPFNKTYSAYHFGPSNIKQSCIAPVLFRSVTQENTGHFRPPGDCSL